MCKENYFKETLEYVSDIDRINIGDIVPGGVVKNTIHGRLLGFTYPFTSLSKTRSTVVNFVIKTAELEEGNKDGSFMVVDIGGNCGFCRSYIPAGPKEKIMFGWEIEGCTEGVKDFSFESNSWYACEQGRIRVVSGEHKGNDYIYLKINGKTVSSFYGNPNSRPLRDNEIYIEATYNLQVLGSNELFAEYFVDKKPYLNLAAQKGFTVKPPEIPVKKGYGFVGWYTAEIGGELFDFLNTCLSDNIKLYARFTSDTVNATFDPKNGKIAKTVKVGKNCLIEEPEKRTFPGGEYEFVFVGWKNETTGKIFDFLTDRINKDTVFSAQYKEKEYYVSYYADGKSVKNVPFVLSNPAVCKNEPDIPEIPNTIGRWQEHKTSELTKNITVNALYSVTVPPPSEDIKLLSFNGSEISLNTDIISEYLATETQKQTKYVRDFFALNMHGDEDHQNTRFFWQDSGKNRSYTVYFADNSDFRNAFIVNTNKASLINEIGIFVPGKTYFWFVYGDDTGKASAVDSFVTADKPVRYIIAGKVTNMRDLGGQETKDGKRVKYGLIYRGGALDEYSSFIDCDARKVFTYLGIKSEIELRGGYAHGFTAWDENNPNSYYIDAEGYQPLLKSDDTKKAQYRAVFAAMADENNYPFYFHCSAGADRTGTLAYLLYGILGVRYGAIRAEYELTSFSWFGLRPADIFNNGFSLDLLNCEMFERYGEDAENIQSAVEKFLTEYIGVPISHINSIRKIMLENRR